MTFRWKDYAHGGKKRKMTLAAEEFIRRFLLHVLPKGLGAHSLLRLDGEPLSARAGRAVPRAAGEEAETARPSDNRWGVCPRCGGAAETVEVIVPRELDAGFSPAT